MSLKVVFCKDSVFVHPSSKTGDNVAGAVLILKDRDNADGAAQLCWIPLNGLNASDKSWLKNCDLKLGSSAGSGANMVMDSGILGHGLSQTWAFSVNLRSLYSLQFRPPSPNGWWFGSVVLHLKTTQSDSLPVLFFHDDTCSSTLNKKKELSKNFDPFTTSGDAYWGGDDLKSAVSKFVELRKTQVDSTVWLVNATLDDLRNFSPTSLAKLEGKENSGVQPESDFWSSWESTKWGMMSRIADATFKTGSIMSNLVKKHPLVKLYERNSDNPYVQKLLQNSKVQEIQNDFDSAKIYLAKWAVGVKERSDKYNLNNESRNSYRGILNQELGQYGDADIQFTDIELNKALERNFPLTKQKWDSFFDSEGRIKITVNEIKDYIFHGGVESMELRKEVWTYLLGVIPWDASRSEKTQLKETLRYIYQNEIKAKWVNRIPDPDENEEEYWHDQLFRIEKDVKRNDRHLDLYKYNTVDGKEPSPSGTENNSNSEDESDDPSSTSRKELKNPHLICLKSILTSYNVYNSNLGYVQGMTDLLSPIYYVMQDEAMAFWCFVNFMERMERNFLRDQAGIRDQMFSLSELCQIMLPKLSEHLTKSDSDNLFFCFRMILVWFKREFEFKDVCSIWEIFWTDLYSSQFQIFFMLAILQKNANAVIQNLSQFDQVLKFFNEINSSMDWNDLMTRSELLFVKFKKMMDLMERKRENNPSLPSSDVYLNLLLSKSIIVEREGERTKDSIK